MVPKGFFGLLGEVQVGDLQSSTIVCDPLMDPSCSAGAVGSGEALR
jgi:hypothetical protein